MRRYSSCVIGEAMRKELVTYGWAAGLLVSLGLSGAEAAATRPLSRETLGLEAAAVPIAMCGYSCRSGGRYIPGPPSVCYEEGLNYCGSSRGGGGPPPGRGFYGGDGYGGGGYGRPYRQGPWYGYGPGRCGASLC
jgi:hypothetical protein